MTSASPLAPTYYGHIASTQDALLLFEACLSGSLHHVARRPHDRERASLIKSGNVFIYEEHSSGIKRWTDGVPWSPSRILGNFLVYRELERPFPPGEKKRAMKRSRRSPGISKPEPYGSSNSMSNGYSAASTASSSFDGPGGTPLTKETERSLIGSLVDSYGFKDDGLVKKTVSVTVGNVSHHLVSYYTVADVTSHKFNSPSKDPRFQHIIPRADLVTKQNFRTPIDEIEPMDRVDDRGSYASPYPYARGGYEMTNQSMIHRQMSLPSPQINYGPSPHLLQTYGMPTTNPGTYETIQPGQPNNNFGVPFAPPQNMYPVVKHEGYDAGGYRQPQRYNSVIGIGADVNRAGMSQPGAQLARRGSNFEQASPVDGGLSGMASTAADPRLTTDSAYPASQAYYNPLRDGNHSPHHQNPLPLRALPTPGQQPTYDRVPVSSSYAVGSASESRDNTWSMGNASSGHGHAYMNPQHHWGGGAQS